MVTLLDANVLIALLSRGHEHHAAARAWFAETGSFATCAITQGAFLRYGLRVGRPATDLSRVLLGFTARSAHEYWSCKTAFSQAAIESLTGHRQVTDFYLAALARSHKGSLATFDQALAASQHDVCELLSS